MIAALVLAAGASSRMGRPKLDLDVGGKTVLERAVDTLLASPVERVLVVVSPDRTGIPLSIDRLGDRSESRLRVVHNPGAEEGMASSIRAGLCVLPDETRALVIALADKPLVRSETIARLVSRFEQGGARIVYPRYRGRQGHPVVIASALFPELRDLEGDSGAKPLLRKHAQAAVPVDVDDPGVLLDIDTPEDYANCLRMLERQA